jgi:hypothetical protein
LKRNREVERRDWKIKMKMVCKTCNVEQPILLSDKCSEWEILQH